MDTIDKYGREIIIINDRKYTLKSLNDNSAKYGPCEVCEKPASEMFLQTEMRQYITYANKLSWTYADCHDYFGHKDCLISKRIA
jgi:hypothetical protein